MICDTLQHTAHCNTQGGRQRTCSHQYVCCWYLLLCCLRYTLQHAATREIELVFTSVRVRTCACVYLLLCFLGHALQHTATHCNTLQHSATLCNTLQHTATHCNTLQHSATLCNTLQHTATHCNTRGGKVAHFYMGSSEDLCVFVCLCCFVP